MTKLNLTMRQLTAEAYPLPRCRPPAHALKYTCPQLRFKAPLSPSSPGQGFPRPLPGHKQEAKVPAAPAHAERQSRNAIAKVHHCYPKATLTYPKAGRPDTSGLLRGGIVNGGQLRFSPRLGLLWVGSKWEGVLRAALKKLFAFQLKSGGCIISHNYIVMLHCLRILHACRAQLAAVAAVRLPLLLFSSVFAVMLFYPRLFCADCLHSISTVNFNRPLLNIIIK